MTPRGRLAATTAAHTGFDPLLTHAIVVAVETFPGANRVGPVAGARRFTTWLLGRGVPAGNVRLLLDPAPGGESSSGGVVPSPVSWEAIHSALTNRATGSGNTLWVYWAGHGFTDTQPFSADLRGTWFRLALPSARDTDIDNVEAYNLLQALRSTNLGRFEQVVCLIDACRDDSRYQVDSGGFQDKRFAPGSLDLSRRVFYGFAAREGQPARQPVDGQPGLFTTALLDSLERSPRGQWPPDLDVVGAEVAAALADSPHLGWLHEPRPPFVPNADSSRLPDHALGRRLTAAAASLLRDVLGPEAPSVAAEVTGVLGLPPTAAELDQVLGLVSAAWESDRVDELHREVRKCSGPDERLQSLYDLVPSRWFTWDDFFKLKEFAHKVDASDRPPPGLLRGLAGMNVPGLGSTGAGPTGAGPAGLVPELVEIDRTRPAADVLAYVEYLAAWADDGNRLDPDVRQGLRQWAKNASKQDTALGQAQRSARRRAADDRKTGQLDPSMLISIRPSQRATDQYWAGAWLWPGHLAARRDLPLSARSATELERDRKLSAPMVVEWIDELLGKKVNSLVGSGRLPKLRLEFFIPPELLGSGLAGHNLWPWESDVSPCAKFTVLVRSLARDEQRTEREFLIQKWNRLVSTKRATPPAVRFVPGPCGSLSDDPAKDLCVVLTHHLPADGFVAFHDKLLRSATPAALWPSSVRPAGAPDDDVEQLIHKGPLAGLPRRLTQWQLGDPRRRAIVLFWDDPHRRLPDSRPLHALAL